MAETSSLRTLTEAIALLSTVSNKLTDKVSKKVSDTVGARLPTSSTTQSDIEPNTQKQVVERPKEVIITDFGRKADDDLVRAFRSTDKKKSEDKDKKDSGSWLSKILGPGTLLMLGAIGGFISSLLDGGFGEIVKDFQGGNYKSALSKVVGKIYSVFKPILHSLPIIGPLISFWDSYKEFNSGNIIGGTNNLIQGVVGLIPGLPMPVKAAMFGGLDILSSLLENKIGKEVIPKGLGGNIMSIILHSFSYIGKIGFLKKLPIIGSFFNFYEAYNSFKAGGVSGIIDGSMSLVAGIAGLFPGIGTGISIGVDVLRSFLFAKKQDETGKKVVVTRGWLQSTWDFIKNRVFDVPLIKGLNTFGEAVGSFITGDYTGGLKLLGSIFPQFAIVSDFVSGTWNTVTDPKTSFAGKMKGVFSQYTMFIRKMALSVVPESLFGFSLRARVAKVFGINNIPIRDDEQLLREQSQDVGVVNTSQIKKVQDFIKVPDSEEVIEPSPDDTVIGFKPDGPIDKIFSKNIQLTSQGNELLKNFSQNSSKLLAKQLEVMIENNKLLIELATKIGTTKSGNNIVTRNNIVNNVSTSTTIRDLQRAYT